MQNKLRNILITIIFIIALALLGTGTYLMLNKSKDAPKNADNGEFYDFPEDQRLSIKNCKTDNCQTKDIDYYDTLTVKSELKQLQEKIKIINQDTKKLYDMANKSTTDTPQCASVKELYHHEYRVNSIFFNYENDKYISVAVQRNISNLCTNNYERKKLDWYLLDKESNKLLTQEQFKEKEAITESAITKVINDTIQQINKEESTNIQPKDNYEDTVVFYDYQGNILVSFYIPELNTYRDATVRVNIEKES